MNMKLYILHMENLQGHHTKLICVSYYNPIFFMLTDFYVGYHSQSTTGPFVTGLPKFETYIYQVFYGYSGCGANRSTPIL